MHPEQHTDLDNLNTVQHNLRNSAKGSNDAYDVIVSLTGEEVVGTFDPPLEDIVPIGIDVARAAMARGFRSLDQITLDTEFRSRGCLMRVPKS